LSGTGVAGSAMQVRGDMKFLKDKLHWNWALRDIDQGFTSIESVGFRQNEKGLTTGLEYQINPKLRFNATLQNSKRPAYDYSNFGLGSSAGFATAKGLDDFTQLNGGFNWSFGAGGQLTLQHNAMDTRMAAGGKSNFLSDSVSLGYKFKHGLGLDLALGRNSNFSSNYFNTTAGGGTGGTTQTLSQYGSSSLTQRLNL